MFWVQNKPTNIKNIPHITSNKKDKNITLEIQYEVLHEK